MDATMLNTIVGVVGIIVGIIGAIIGIIGWKSLATATKISNRAKANNGSTVQQAQIIHNGLDDYAVIRLSKETTQEELQRLVASLQLVTEKEIKELGNEITDVTKDIRKLNETVNSMPRIHIGKEPPQNVKNGDIWFDIR